MNQPLNVAPPVSSELNLRAHWMPFSANRNFQKDPRIIVAAEGSWLTDDKGRKVYDSLSGLWTCGAGHSRKEIQEAVARQLGTLDYSPGFQYGHPLSFQLAEKIAGLLPGELNHVFFTGSGSECADTSIKMARAYWRLKGQPQKTKLIGRARGYHGVNVAGTSLGGIGGNRKMFGSLLTGVDHIRHTHDPARNAYSVGQPAHGAEIAEDCHLPPVPVLLMGTLTATAGAAFGTGAGGTTGTIQVTNNAANANLGTGAITVNGATNAAGGNVTLSSQGGVTVSGLINTTGGARGTGVVGAGMAAGNITITGTNNSVTGAITASGGTALGAAQAGGSAGTVSITGAGTLNTVGITASGGVATTTGAGGAAGSITLSGSNGRSLFAGAPVVVTFSSPLPVAAGLVWTDGGTPTNATFEAFDAGAERVLALAEHARERRAARRHQRRADL